MYANMPVLPQAINIAKERSNSLSTEETGGPPSGRESGAGMATDSTAGDRDP